jgi:vWA domain found in the FtsH ternary systems
MSAEERVVAALALARPGAVDHLDWSLEALEVALSERPHLSAPWLPFDVLELLLHGRLSAAPQSENTALQDALRDWEDHVLVRLLSDARWARVEDAWGGLPAGLRPRAAGLLAARIDAMLDAPPSGDVPAALVRRLRETASQELVARGRAALKGKLSVASQTSMREAAKRGRGGAVRLSDADVVLVQRFEALQGMAGRVLLSQLADVAQALEESLASRPKLQARAAEVTTRLDDASEYPVGGFSEVTTRGSFENLVATELAGLEDDARPDLFDVRYVENELLFYARDEGVALRRRKAVAVVFDASLDTVRVLDEGQKHQRLVLALGLVVAVLRKGVEWLESSAVRFLLVFPRGKGDAGPLEDERQVVELLLAPERERGAVAVEVLPEEQLEAHLSEALGPRPLVVRVGTEPGGPSGITLSVALPKPRLQWDARLGEPSSWDAVARELAEAIAR